MKNYLDLNVEEKKELFEWSSYLEDEIENFIFIMNLERRQDNTEIKEVLNKQCQESLNKIIRFGQNLMKIINNNLGDNEIS